MHRESQIRSFVDFLSRYYQWFNCRWPTETLAISTNANDRVLLKTSWGNFTSSWAILSFGSIAKVLCCHLRKASVKMIYTTRYIIWFLNCHMIPNEYSHVWHGQKPSSVLVRCNVSYALVIKSMTTTPNEKIYMVYCLWLLFQVALLTLLRYLRNSVCCVIDTKCSAEMSRAHCLGLHLGLRGYQIPLLGDWDNCSESLHS